MIRTDAGAPTTSFDRPRDRPIRSVAPSSGQRRPSVVTPAASPPTGRSVTRSPDDPERTSRSPAWSARTCVPPRTARMSRPARAGSASTSRLASSWSSRAPPIAPSSTTSVAPRVSAPPPRRARCRTPPCRPDGDRCACRRLPGARRAAGRPSRDPRRARPASFPSRSSDPAPPSAAITSSASSSQAASDAPSSPDATTTTFIGFPVCSVASSVRKRRTARPEVRLPGRAAFTCCFDFLRRHDPDQVRGSADASASALSALWRSPVVSGLCDQPSTRPMIGRCTPTSAA